MLRGRFLECLGTDSTQITVTARSIVERFDVVRDIRPRDLPVLVDALPDPLLLQAPEEGLGNRIVPAVSPSTHAGLQTMASAKPPPVIAAVLRALIGVNDGLAGGRLSRTAIRTASRMSSRPIVGFVAHPTILRV